MTYGSLYPGHHRRNLYSAPCAICKIDTPHRMSCCIFCKTMTEPSLGECAKIAILNEVSEVGFSGYRRKAGARLAKIRNARNKNFAAKAAASRQMFEGKT